MANCICVSDGKCTACSACVSSCPNNCISIDVDSDGNYYPKVDESKCSGCGLCKNVCPLTNRQERFLPLCGYVTRCKDLVMLDECNSGGFFSALAEYVIKTGGNVYGAVLDDKNIVRHIRVSGDNAKDLEKIRGSKYVKSDLNGVFCEIKSLLESDSTVCFSGTPCQVAGLRSYLRKDYEKLICVDLVCHGTSLTTYFEKYTSYMENKFGSHINLMRFRNKTYGYHSGTMKIRFENGKEYYGSGRVDYFLKAYYSGATYSEACYNCQFKGMERFGDFTVFDSWHVSTLVEDLKDDDKGFTNVYLNTDKAKRIFAELESEIVSYRADIIKMKELDGKMIDKSFQRFKFRSELLKECENDFFRAVQKYLHVSTKDRIIETTKKLIYKSSIYRYFSYHRR